MPRGCEGRRGPAVCGGGQVGAPGAHGKARVVVSVPQAAVPQQHSKHNALSCGYISSVSVEACAVPWCLSISWCRQWKPELSAGCCWGRSSTVLKGAARHRCAPGPLQRSAGVLALGAPGAGAWGGPRLVPVSVPEGHCCL